MRLATMVSAASAADRVQRGMFEFLWKEICLYPPIEGNLTFSPTGDIRKETRPVDLGDTPDPPRATKKRRTARGSKVQSSSAGDVEREPPVAEAAQGHGVDIDGIERSEGGSVEQTPSESEPPLDPEMAVSISKIMGHSDRVEEHHALGEQKMEGNLEDSEGAISSGMVYVKANDDLKMQSLPILDNLVSRTGEYIIRCLS